MTPRSVNALLLACLLPWVAWAQFSGPTALPIPPTVGGGTTLGFNDDTALTFGTGNDASIEYDTTNTPDAWVFGVSTDSNILRIGEKADMSVDYAHAKPTNPTLEICSADQTDTNDCLQISFETSPVAKYNTLQGGHFWTIASTPEMSLSSTALNLFSNSITGIGATIAGTAQTPLVIGPANSTGTNAGTSVTIRGGAASGTAQAGSDVVLDPGPPTSGGTPGVIKIYGYNGSGTAHAGSLYMGSGTFNIAPAGSGITGVAIGNFANPAEYAAKFYAPSSSVNFSNINGGATGTDPLIYADGSDTNRNLHLSGRGTGGVKLSVAGGATPIATMNASGLIFDKAATAVIGHAAQTSDALTSGTTISAQDAFQSAANLSNPHGAALALQGGNCNLLDTDTCIGGPLDFAPGKSVGATAPGMYNFYNNKEDQDYMFSLFGSGGSNDPQFVTYATTQSFQFGWQDGSTTRNTLRIDHVSSGVEGVSILQGAAGAGATITTFDADDIGDVDLVLDPQESGDVRVVGAFQADSLDRATAGTLNLATSTQTAVNFGRSGTDLSLGFSTVSFGDGVNVVLNTGSGTKFGTATSQKIGFWNAAPVVQPSSTGQTSGFTANASANTVFAESTFTGGVGSTAYTLGDVVKHLKTIGALAQ